MRQQQEYSQREKSVFPHRRKRVFILGIKRGTEREGLEWVNELLDRNRDTSGSVYPASRGREQYSWEPPRVTVEKPSYDRSGAGGSVYEDGGNMEGGGESLSEERSTQTGDIRGTDPSDDEERVEETRVLEPRSRNEVEPEMGRDVDGASNGVGYAKLYESFDNRTDGSECLEMELSQTLQEELSLTYGENWSTPPASQRGENLRHYISRMKNRLEQGKETFAPTLQVQAEAEERGVDIDDSIWATPNTMDSLSLRSEEALRRQATTTRKGRTAPANLREQVDPKSCEIYASESNKFKGQVSLF